MTDHDRLLAISKLIDDAWSAEEDGVNVQYRSLVSEIFDILAEPRIKEASEPTKIRPDEMTKKVSEWYEAANEEAGR